MNAFIDPNKLLNIAYSLALILFGFFLAKRVSLILERKLSKRISRHHLLLITRLIFYGIVLLFLAASLQFLGFRLGVLLGAAGVFTVAIGFASQTAISNLISGIFLLFEHPFKVGDNIEIKGIKGIVESIDLLSTKLKTPDNRLVRVPNESMIKSEITNLSYYAKRRIELVIAAAYNSDIAKMKTKLLAIAANCSLVFKTPVPLVYLSKLDTAAIELKLIVWTKTSELIKTQDVLQEMITKDFTQQSVELPLPIITVNCA